MTNQPEQTPGARYHTSDECLTRYPRLSAMLKDLLILSSNEAGGCIRDYRSGIMYGGESISWCGRTTEQAIKQTISLRHAIRRDLARRFAEASK